MSFKKNKYIMIKKVVSKELAVFLYNYILIKRQVARTLVNTKYISPFEKMFGSFGDGQVPETYAVYGDVAMETLLLKLQPKVEKETGLKLLPNYAYTRIYKRGDELKKHIDRFSCEISTTINLGGEPWPIYVKPIGKIEGVKIDLKPGDMLIYRGDLLEHWRDYFNGQTHAQVFLHYNNAKTKKGKENIYDERIHLGLIKDPMFLQKKEKND
jgi:hypothetical protein|tara:strand:+ start:3789 stop:4424 length:636 start_codon:yes stop_codon:yes gene_type:complete